VQNKWNLVSGLYIHWPFCPYRCSFCPFVALANHEKFMERYTKALCTEIELFKKELTSKPSIKTVFIGGGTPSTWPNDLLLDTSGKLKDVFTCNKMEEITIEINPGTVQIQQLPLWKQIGINRLSIGVQCLNDNILRKLNRHHTKKDVYFLMEHACKEFNNISIDLILGLPFVDEIMWKELVREVVTWPIQHISIYTLAVHKPTKLFFDIQSGSIKIPDDDVVADLYEWSVNFLNDNGFDQYEVSNFARSGYESKHNMAYWNRLTYKGFGLGACSFDGKMRTQNQKSLLQYLTLLEAHESVIDFKEELTQEQESLELIMLGLRTIKGVSYGDLVGDGSEKERSRRDKYIMWLKTNNLMYESEGQLILTTKGMVVEDEIVATFFSGKE